MPKGIFIRSEEHKQKLRDNLKKLVVKGEEWDRKFPGRRCAIRDWLRSWKIRDPEGWKRHCKGQAKIWEGRKHNSGTLAKMSITQRKLRTAWKGGRVNQSQGYILIWLPSHPNHSNGYVLEHRLVMEQVLGRLLTRLEEVHHINEIRSDNRPGNLKLFPSKAAHSKYHDKLGKVNEPKSDDRINRQAESVPVITG